MLEQTFVVTVEIPSPFDCYFPRVEAERIASIIRDGIQLKGVSFLGPTPFTITVRQADKAVSTMGQVREYEPVELAGAEGAPEQTARTAKAV